MMQELRQIPKNIRHEAHPTAGKEEKPAMRLSDYLGHLLFIATAFNWFLVFVLMQFHGDIYVTEVSPIREVEIGLTGLVCAFAFVWFLKKIKAS